MGESKSRLDLRNWVMVGAALSLFACGNEHAPFKPGGGGGGGSGSASADAGPIADAGLEMVTIRGRVCGLGNLQQPTACGAIDYTGFTILFADQLATAAGDGSFTMEIPAAAAAGFAEVAAPGVGFHKSHVAVVPSAFVASADLVASFGVVTNVNLGDVLAVTGANLPSGSGAVIAYIRAGESPLAGAIIPAPATAPYPTFYDNGGALLWSTVQTGASGTALLVGIPATTSLTFTATTGVGDIVYSGIPVVVDAITLAVPSYFQN